MTDVIPAALCKRLHGGSVRYCVCRLPVDGWLECPPAQERHLTLSEQRVMHRALRRSTKALTGDICADCGSPNMVRTGTCMTCQDCGSTSGGCS
jgi:hypothetical protein